jgi:hypothetical protein
MASMSRPVVLRVVVLAEALGPEDDLEDGVVASEIVDFGVATLAGGEIEFGALSSLLDLQATGFLTHFERLHKIDHAHFFETALDDARTRCMFLEFLEMQAIDYFLGGTDQVLDEERFGDEILGTINKRTESLFDVRTAGHEEERNVAGGFAATEFFEELATVEAGHVVVAEDDVRRFIDDFEQSVGTVSSDHNFAERIKSLGDEVADHGVILGEKQLDGFAGSGAHRFGLREDFAAGRW